MEQTAISKIEVKLADGRTLDLTPQQARELRDILDEVYPKYRAPTIPMIVERQVYIPQKTPYWYINDSDMWTPNYTTTTGKLTLSVTE